MRARREGGAASLEYTGVLLLASAVVFTIVTVVAQPDLSPIRRAWCLITSQVGGARCEDGAGRADGALPDVPWFRDPGRTPEGRAIRGEYVGLGDSYSSGEGGSEYLPGTDDDNQWKNWWDQHGLWPGDVHQNMCHRSTRAFAMRVAGDFDFQGGHTFNACSGAVIDDFYRPSADNHNDGHDNRDNMDEDAQLSHLSDRTSLVTFSVGGNDVGFAPMIQECVTATFKASLPGGSGSFCHTSATAQEVRQRISSTRDRLAQLLRDMRQKAPNARIIVMGYPRFFPDPPTERAGFIQPEDQAWINTQVYAMNDAMAHAVRDAGGAAAGFEFVDPRDALRGCEIGTSNSCMNGLDVGLGGNFDSGKPVSNGSFHPNDEGHRRLAELLERQIREGQP